MEERKVVQRRCPRRAPCFSLLSPACLLSTARLPVGALVAGRAAMAAAWPTALLLCLARLPARPVCSAKGFGTRTIGVDFGLRRTGLAVSAGIAPLPLGIIAEENMTLVARQVAQAARAEGASQFVLGMPYNSSGGEGDQAQVTRAFGQLLAHEAAPLPVYVWDERYSSAEASIRMHQGGGAVTGEFVDAVAAAIILEEFFDGDHASAERIMPPPELKQEASQRPVVPLGPPPSYMEVRRKMMERAAEQQANLAAAPSSQSKKKRKKKR